MHQERLTRLARSLRPIRSVASKGAWFFIVVSLLRLLGAIVVKWTEPSGTFKLYHTVVDGVSYDAPWLTYQGPVGLVFAMLQFIVVAAAATATALPWQRSVGLRRAGHTVLVGWAGLWTADLLSLWSIDGRWDSRPLGFRGAGEPDVRAHGVHAHPRCNRLAPRQPSAAGAAGRHGQGVRAQAAGPLAREGARARAGGGALGTDAPGKRPQPRGTAPEAAGDERCLKTGGAGPCRWSPRGSLRWAPWRRSR
jgi:hypothetical protein